MGTRVIAVANRPGRGFASRTAGGCVSCMMKTTQPVAIGSPDLSKSELCSNKARFRKAG